LRVICGLAVALALLAPVSVLAAPTPSPIPCLKTLKFAGALYLDTDSTVPPVEVGGRAGVSDPDPAYCGIAAGSTVYVHRGHPASRELIYYSAPGVPSLFTSAGNTGLPMQDLVRWLVLALAVGIVGFAAVPAILGHVRQPPIEVGNKDDDVYDPPKIDVDDTQ
jgi:hypothetical protein